LKGQAVADDHVFTLNGDERWLVRFTDLKGQAYGYTYSQKSKRPRILIHSGLTGRHRLTIIVHELLHALFPTASEEHVEQAGKDIAKVLYSLSYREVQDGP
jgi:Zn-dependent peptidase ImmA (M78 family)